VKALYAISCICRDHPAAVAAFAALDGWSVLLRAIQTTDVPRLRTKACFFLSNVAVTDPSIGSVPTLQGVILSLSFSVFLSLSLFLCLSLYFVLFFSAWGVLETNIFFRFEPKQTETRSVSVFFGLFRKNHNVGFFSVCFGVSDRYRNNQKQNFFETNRKNLKKTLY
jgi:hypothetical protein